MYTDIATIIASEMYDDDLKNWINESAPVIWANKIAGVVSSAPAEYGCCHKCECECECECKRESEYGGEGGREGRVSMEVNVNASLGVFVLGMCCEQGHTCYTTPW